MNQQEAAAAEFLAQQAAAAELAAQQQAAAAAAAHAPAPAEHNQGSMAQFLTAIQPFLANVAILASAISSRGPDHGPNLPERTQGLPPGVKAPRPPPYDGKSKKNCVPWTTSLRTYFQVTGVNLNTRKAVQLASTYLIDAAQMWWQSRLDTCRKDGDPDDISGGYLTFDEFAAALQISLGDPMPELKARKELQTLRQITSVTKYAWNFQRIIMSIPHPDVASLKFQFWYGLKSEIQKLLAGRVQDCNTWLDIRDLAHEYDEIVTDQRYSSYSPAPRRNYRDNRPDDPMDLSSAHVSHSSRSRAPTPGPSRGRTPSPASRRSTPDRPRLTKLTSEERDKLRSAGACFRCRKPGHISANCPLGRPASNGKYRDAKN